MKRRLLLIFGLLLCATAAHASCSSTSFGNGVTCVQENISGAAGSGTSQTTTLGSNTTSGHEVTVYAWICQNNACGGDPSGISMTPSSGASDSFIASPSGCTAVYHDLMNDWVKICIWYVKSVGVTTTFTVTCGSTCWYLSVYVAEWNGLANSSTPFDQDAFASVAANTSFTCSGGTTANANDLFFGGISGGSSLSFTAGTGFTEIGQDVTGDEHEGKTVTSTQTLSTTWTSSSQTGQYGCAGIKIAGAASSCTPTLTLLGVGRCG